MHAIRTYIFCRSLNRLQLGLSAKAELLFANSGEYRHKSYIAENYTLIVVLRVLVTNKWI